MEGKHPKGSELGQSQERVEFLHVGPFGGGGRRKIREGDSANGGVRWTP